MSRNNTRIFLFICTMILYESIICSSIRNEGRHVRIKIKSTPPFLCRCVLDLIASHLKTKVSIKYKKKENPNSQPMRRILKFKTFTFFFRSCNCHLFHSYNVFHIVLPFVSLYLCFIGVANQRSC